MSDENAPTNQTEAELVHSRPCTCDRQQGGKWVKGRDCFLCWLYHNSPKHRRIWNNPASPAERSPPGPSPSPPSPLDYITPAERAELFGDQHDSDPTLLGNRVAAMTAAIGIPPCGGCGKRKEWLNKAHQWVRDAIAR